MGNSHEWQPMVRRNRRNTVISKTMDIFLQATDSIDWQHPAILDLAKELAAGHETVNEIANVSFQWVRDNIYHSFDYQLNPVTCRASDVLQHRTGYCYAKSHLLAALLRANKIPAGLCYQRLSIDDRGAPYCLHGLNAAYLPETGWYRMDARGNREGVDAQFNPPQEHLAFTLQLAGETDFPKIFSDPLEIVVAALQRYTTWDELLKHLPDVPLDLAKDYGLWH